MVGLLALTGAATGALVGLVVGALWRAGGWGPLSSRAAAAVAVSAVTLDLLRARTGWAALRPWAVHRQVPIEWGTMFPAPVTAVLYGARLGVGPLTILTSWTWWSMLGVGASFGPWWSALVGAAFAVARTAIMTLVVSGATGDGRAMSRRIARVTGAEGRVRGATAIALVLVAALALAACSNDGDSSADGSAGESTTSVGSLDLVPATTTTTTPEAKALDALLLDDPLTGFSRDDLAVGAGPLDLDGAAALEDDEAAERALLETRRFVRGASRAWTNAGDDVLLLTVYEFADVGGAARYLQDGAEALEARGATGFEVPGLDGAIGFSTVEDTGSGSFVAHAVAFSVGTRWCLVLVGSSSSGSTPDDVRTVAAAQHQRISAAG